MNEVADRDLNRTVKVLLQMNLSPHKLAEGIRLAVQQSKRQTEARTPQQQRVSDDDRLSRSNSISSRNSTADPGSSESNTEESMSVGHNAKKKRKRRSKNIDTPAAMLAKNICKEFLLSRRVLQLLYDESGRVSNFRLKSALDQVKGKLSADDQRVLEAEQQTVLTRCKRVLSLGKNYRSKAAKSGKHLPDAPNEHMIVIDLSGSGDEATKDSLDKQFSDAIAAEAPGRAAIARRTLFNNKSDPKSKSSEKPKSGEEPERSKVEAAKKFKERLDSIRKRPARRKTANQKSKTAKNRRANVTAAAIKRRRVSKRQSARKASENLSKTTEVETETEDEPTPTPPSAPRQMTANFKPGDTVTGQWNGPTNKGEWYTGVVKSIDLDNETVHIVYKDGDQDENLSWAQMRIPG